MAIMRCLSRLGAMSQKKVRNLVVFGSIICIFFSFPSLLTSPTWRQNFNQTFLHQILEKQYFSNIMIGNNESTLTGVTKILQLAPRDEANATKLLTTRNASHTTTNANTIPKVPYNDRFKFIYKKEKVSLNGPIVNTIPQMVSWREDLSQVNICNSTDPFILGIVGSAVKNREQRDKIRSTWGNPALYPYTGIRVVFVLGATTDQKLQEVVEAEVKQYKDIIQNNFIDSYQNLTYKTMSWLKWVDSRCPQVPFVAKIDDDVLVNPFNLNKYLRDQLKKPAGKELESKVEMTSETGAIRPELSHPATNLIYGRLEQHSPPHRGGRWGVTKEQYPEPYFPPFVLGPAYILGGNAIGRLVKYAPYTPTVWLEDVCATGLVAYAAQVKHVGAEGPLFIARGFSGKSLYESGKAFWVEHGKSDKTSVWKQILSNFPAQI